jgi:cytochrome b561
MRVARAIPDRYSTGAIWFHWIIAALVIVNLAIGLFHESLLKGVHGAMPLHKSVGLTVLVLTVAFILWRLAHRRPSLPTDMPAWQRAAAHGAHWGLYALLLIMPLSGWAMVSNSRHPMPLEWFGVPVPFLPVAKSVSGAAHQSHTVLGWVMLALVALHVLAALRHHVVQRDSVLTRMLPIIRR